MTTLRKEMIAVRVRAAAVLTSLLVASAVVAQPSPARAVVDGIDVTITELPDEFEAGADPRTVEVVASTDREPRRPSGRQRCRKIRWSLVVQLDGARLDQVRVDRIEENGSFPVRVQTEGDTARLTDVRLDPGRLCRDRTVTARYRVAFDDGTPAGAVSFRAQAFGADDTLLQAASGASRVIGDDRSPSPSPSPSDDATAAEDDVAVADSGGPGLSATAGAGGTPSLLGPGLVIGAVLVFLGVGLLLRIRMRSRGARHGRRSMPPPVYPAP